MNDQTLHHFMQNLTDMVVMTAMTVAAAWVIGKIIGAFRHRARLLAQADLYNRILEKFGSAAEFTAFLQSAEGRGFFENQAVETAAPLVKILNSVKIGVILLIVGGGFFVLSLLAKTPDAIFALDVICVVVFTLGIGFLVSSVISLRLAKRWGLIAVEKPAVAAAPTASTTA